MSKEEALKIEFSELSLKELDVLEDLNKDHVKNAIYYFTRPNPPQELLLKAWRDPTKKVFTFTGGNRMGKTTIGTILALCTVFGEYPWSGERIQFPHNKPRKVRYVGQDWEKHIQAVVIEALNKWWPAKHIYKIKKNQQGIETLWIDVESGSSLEIMSNKQESGVYEGWEGDLIVYDEPPTRDIRVACSRGLIDRTGRELFSMTLLKEAWVDREVIKAKDENGRPDPTVFNVQGQIYDNVGYGITEEGVEQFAKTLTDDEKDARLRGVPSYKSGLVYPEFRRELHLKRRFPHGIPLDWIVDILIDVHPREKQAVLFTATAPDNRKYSFHEIWDNGDGTFVGEEVVRYVQAHSLRVGTIAVDPLSKGDRNNRNTVFDKIENVLIAHGLCLETASKDKSSGINLIKTHLMSPNGEPAWFLLDECVRTVYEIEGYMWDKDTQKPVDKDDHMMENLYRTMLLDTKWTEPEEENEPDVWDNIKRNTHTGY